MHWNEYHFFRKPCFQSVKFMKFVVSLTSIFVRSAEAFYSFSVTFCAPLIKTVNTSRNNWFFFKPAKYAISQSLPFSIIM